MDIVRFGRVYGVIMRRSPGELWLTVVLDTGREIRTVRDEAVPAALSGEDPYWLADQLVQETIGVELAVEGWEAIGEGTGDAEDPVEVTAVAASPVWIVRQV